MHSIRNDFGFNLLRSASKLKSCVIEGTGGLFWFSMIVDFSFPIVFVGFYVSRIVMRYCPWIVFSQIYFTFFMIYASRLRFCEPFFFNVVFCVCSLLFFFLNPDLVSITWITGHTHRSIVDKIDPTSEDVEMVKKNTLSITLGYIFLWNVIRRIYLPCLQLISKKYLWWTVTRIPPFF